ncbi:sulfurtransferase complex subunit TusB [Marinobacter sp. JSM 1782161]|uniref:sulfurtransferase complex subunit TusB n=1 Tax=Marinobacter sp. JSM 1782161 TaxID=2685906 RepID=UPI001401CD0B|nr:sulfurtransferase complex subunit TusB [Marinobacter sp. JSM 1782161]
MPTLHILNKDPDHPRFSACIDALRQGDTLLLTENGVLGLLDEALQTPADANIKALAPDLAARGLETAPVKPNVAAIEFSDFVPLTLSFEKVVCW